MPLARLVTSCGKLIVHFHAPAAQLAALAAVLCSTQDGLLCRQHDMWARNTGQEVLKGTPRQIPGHPAIQRSTLGPASAQCQPGEAWHLAGMLSCVGVGRLVCLRGMKNADEVRQAWRLAG